MKNRMIKILFMVVIIVGLIPIGAVNAFAENGVLYLDANGETQTADNVTEITKGGEYGPGWYLLRGTQNMDTIAFNKSGEVHLIIENGADVTVNGGILLYGYITSLNIYGQPTGAGEMEGKLTACSSNNNAGIGSGEEKDCGDIIVNGGTVIAKGNVFGAGIGAGCRRRCGNITINGGHVTAIGGQHSAGIGTGFSGRCGNITVGGGTVIATGTHASAGIGTGVSGSCGSITVTDATVTATGGYGAPGIGGGASGSCGDININDTLTIKAGADADSAQTVEKYEGQKYCSITYISDTEPIDPDAQVYNDVPYLDANGETKTADNVTEITEGGEYPGGWYILRKGTTGLKTITLNNNKIENIDMHLIIENGADVTIDGGICLGGDYLPSLTIYAQPTSAGEIEGKLTTIGSDNNASIGTGQSGKCGHIIINGGIITATGGSRSAGIGTGYLGRSRNITINGGTVTATGSVGIGAGVSSICDDIIINGGIVTAIGPTNGTAGIGTGVNGKCGDITINGGIVTAIGGKGGAAIGAGYRGKCRNITITGTPEIKAGADADSAEIVSTYNGERYVSLTYMSGTGSVPSAEQVQPAGDNPKTGTTGNDTFAMAVMIALAAGLALCAVKCRARFKVDKGGSKCSLGGSKGFKYWGNH